MLPVVLKHFRLNSLKTSLFSQKSEYLRKLHRILKKFVFLNNFEKGQILKKFGFVKLFLFKAVKWDNY